jgi:hypothetical protein
MTLIEKPFSVFIYLLLILGIIGPKLWPLIYKRAVTKTKSVKKTKKTK